MKLTLKNLLSEMPDLIFESLGIFALLDEQGYYLYVSTSWAKQINCTTYDVIGKHVTEFFPDSNALKAMASSSPILAHVVKNPKQRDKQQFTSYFPIIYQREVLGCAIITFFKDNNDALQFSKSFARIFAERNLYREELLQIQNDKYSIDKIIGMSAGIQKVKQQIRLAARTNSNVLIEGETGTGKELVSHSIHNLSDRAAKPLIKLNCAAIPLQLAESELFGYEQGAFTGANKGGKIGKFELANNSTLFLDEINQLSYYIQPKLLRAIQEMEIERVGGNKTIPINVRLIAATNKSLEGLINANKFRMDLYYRLNVIYIRIPPLRERIEDIPLLCSNILDRLNLQLGTMITGISDEAIHLLEKYDWPGNIRELQNILERAMNEKLSGTLTIDDFSDLLKSSIKTISQKTTNQSASQPIAAQPNVYHKAIIAKQQIEKETIENALKEFAGNKKRTAEYLGISRTNLYNKIKQYNINF